ncbi:hypothetical protein ABZT03_20030 [Streptomyces sp. NPDC005574]|uniref:hypothetical protein n=1 Tax=Streptomyces sp. NPDC005574 TaxID=3156891 RepID=UPI0033A4F66C
MHRPPADDLSRLPELPRPARDFAAAEPAGLAERPVARLGEAPAPAALPARGAGAEGALARFAAGSATVATRPCGTPRAPGPRARTTAPGAARPARSHR